MAAYANNNFRYLSKNKFNFMGQVVCFRMCCPKPLKGSKCWTGLGTAGRISKGSSIHSHKSLYVKRFHRKKATRFDSDQENLDLNCRYLISSKAINAVQIWMKSAFSLVPTNVLTFKFCFRSLKNSSIFQRSL